MPSRMVCRGGKQNFALCIKNFRVKGAANAFDKGSMGPKIKAMINFLEGGGLEGLITDPPNIPRALNGMAGTWIVRNG